MPSAAAAEHNTAAHAHGERRGGPSRIPGACALMSCPPGLRAYAMKHAAVGRCYVLPTHRATLTNGGALAVSLHVLPAIDGDVCAVHERRFFRTQVDDQSSDLCRQAQPPGRYLRQNLCVEHFLR